MSSSHTPPSDSLLSPKENPYRCRESTSVTSFKRLKATEELSARSIALSGERSGSGSKVPIQQASSWRTWTLCGSSHRKTTKHVLGWCFWTPHRALDYKCSAHLDWPLPPARHESLNHDLGGENGRNGPLALTSWTSGWVLGTGPWSLGTS